MHVHAKAGTDVRTNDRKDEMKNMKTGGRERKEEKRCVKGKRMKGETK